MVYLSALLNQYWCSSVVILMWSGGREGLPTPPSWPETPPADRFLTKKIKHKMMQLNSPLTCKFRLMAPSSSLSCTYYKFSMCPFIYFYILYMYMCTYMGILCAFFPSYIFMVTVNTDLVYSFVLVIISHHKNISYILHHFPYWCLGYFHSFLLL